MSDISFMKTLIIIRVIECICHKYKMSIDDARNLFYKSKTFKLIKDDATELYAQSPLNTFVLFEEEYEKRS